MLLFSHFFWQPKAINFFSIFAPVIRFTLLKLCLKGGHGRLFASLFSATVPFTQVVMFVLSWLECSRLVREAGPGVWCRVSRKVGESLRSALSFSCVRNIKTRGSLTMRPGSTVGFGFMHPFALEFSNMKYWYYHFTILVFGRYVFYSH